MTIDQEATPTEADNHSGYVAFLLVSDLKDLCFNPHRQTPLTYKVSSPEIDLSIRSRNTPETGREGFDNLECRASCVLPASRDEAAFVAHLVRGTYLAIPGSPIQLPVRVKGEERIDRDGRILVTRSIPYELYPTPVQQLWKSAYSLLVQTQERFLRLLRWSEDLDGPHELYEHPPSLYWHAHGGDSSGAYHATQQPEVGGRTSAEPRGICGIVWNEEDEATVRDLWTAEENEPLAHELLREARKLAAAGSYRGALLMAATAVETGVKDHIGRLRPHTSWILQNSPSPPIHSILRRYVQEMHADSSAVADWNKLAPLWNACERLAYERNKTSHVGRHVEPGALDTHLETATNTLYVLDVLAGHQWARQRVTTTLRRSLGWPDPKEIRLTATWAPGRWEIDQPTR